VTRNLGRKHAILFAATLLCARKLVELDDRPSPAKLAAVENAISQAKFILDRIAARWPDTIELDRRLLLTVCLDRNILHPHQSTLPS